MHLFLIFPFPSSMTLIFLFVLLIAFFLIFLLFSLHLPAFLLLLFLNPRYPSSSLLSFSFMMFYFSTYSFCHNLPSTYSTVFFSFSLSLWSSSIYPHMSPHSSSFLPPIPPPLPFLHSFFSPTPPPSSGINCLRLTSLH